MGRLERHLDQDAIACLQSGIKRQDSGPTIKHTKPPKAAQTYRAHRRNAELRGEVKGTWRGAPFVPEIFSPRIALNRSQNWRRAESYLHARSLAPNPNIPVR